MRTVALLIIACLALPGCTSLFFYPHRHEVITPENLGLAYRDVVITTPDDLKLHGWLLLADGAAPDATVIFLHGNAENISTHIIGVHWLPARNFNVLIVDYRGYGRSEGRATLKGVIRDVNAILEYAVQDAEIGRTPLVVLGQSLGGALAVQTIARSPYKDRIAALVIDSTFSTYRGITREKMAELWLTWPLQWLPWITIPARYDPVRVIDEISPIPLLVMHGAADIVIPASHAPQLFAAAQEPKELWLAPDKGHIQALQSPEGRERVTAFLRRSLQGENDSAMTRPEIPAAQ